MGRPKDVVSVEQAQRALEDLLSPGAPLKRVAGPAPSGPDLRLQGPGVVYLLEWKPNGSAANVGRAIDRLRADASSTRERRSVVRIVAVPFMGETGRRLCAEAGVSWIDLSGNAWIDGPGTRIRILGNRNRFAAAGRPASLFGPRGSRVTRALLLAPGHCLTQAQLVQAAGIDRSQVSRLIRRMEAEGLLIRDRAGQGRRLGNPALALEAWREAYDFEKHRVLRGHVSARSPEELTARLAELTGKSSWALTGLAAAWHLTRFAMYRLTSAYLREPPSASWLERLGFTHEPRGANLWLVVPNDDAVFEGASALGGVPCVHPIQAYLDLKAQPERSKEAAEELKRRLLRWDRA